MSLYGSIIYFRHLTAANGAIKLIRFCCWWLLVSDSVEVRGVGDNRINGSSNREAAVPVLGYIKEFTYATLR